MTLATSHGSAARLSASWPASSAKRPVRFSISHSRMRRRSCSSSGLTGPAPLRRRTRGPAGGVAGPRELRVWPATGRRAYAQPTKHLLHWRPPGGADGPGCSRRRSGEVRRRAGPRRAGRPRISYHQLLHQTTTVTRALIAEGVTPEDRVAIWSPNTHQWVLAAFGALSAGATLVPVSIRSTGPEALDVITRSGAVRADRRPIASSAPARRTSHRRRGRGRRSGERPRQYRKSHSGKTKPAGWPRHPRETAPRGPRADAGCHGIGGGGRPGGRGHRLHAHCSHALTGRRPR